MKYLMTRPFLLVWLRIKCNTHIQIQWQSTLSWQLCKHLYWNVLSADWYFTPDLSYLTKAMEINFPRTEMYRQKRRNNIYSKINRIRDAQIINSSFILCYKMLFFSTWTEIFEFYSVYDISCKNYNWKVHWIVHIPVS